MCRGKLTGGHSCPAQPSLAPSRPHPSPGAQQLVVEFSCPFPVRPWAEPSPPALPAPVPNSRGSQTGMSHVCGCPIVDAHPPSPPLEDAVTQVTARTDLEGQQNAAKELKARDGASLLGGYKTQYLNERVWSGSLPCCASAEGLHTHEQAPAADFILNFCNRRCLDFLPVRGTSLLGAGSTPYPARL